MGKKGSPQHRKRLSAPIAYPIQRKHGIFTIKPYPTRSTMESSIPLGIIIREILGYAKTLSEVKKILSRKMVKIDGRIQTSHKSSLGPMDVLEITKTEEYFRMLPYRGKRRFKLHPISKDDAHLKMQRIKRKNAVKNGLIQLTFHDGRNYLLDPEEEQKFPIAELTVKDSVMFNLEDKIIEDHYPFAEGNTAVIMGGHNVGIVGKIQEIEAQSGRKTRTVTLETDEGKIKTTDRHLFVIGREEPVIDIPQETGAEEDEL
ncbi:MAG: 30S ribosomal protein S4e [Candidatus Hodarchaeota archaeon]